MKLVGLTGGIGSGKTTCAYLFSLLGIQIYSSDEEAKRLMADDEKVKTQIIDLLGTAAYDDSGQLNRAYISKMIFAKKDLLQGINGIVHPAVRKDFYNWSQMRTYEDYVIQESALLFETGSYESFDRTILVDAPESLRIHRTMMRDRSTAEDIKKRMANQWSSDKKRKLADFVIENHGEYNLLDQILEIHKRITGRQSLFS